jgi:micrococcal nuclease
MILQESFLTKVVKICDGDTITVQELGKNVRIRIAWIDAPEDGQPGCREAREELKGLIGGGLVKVQTMETDCYGRYISRVWTEKGKDINEAMLESGWAVYYAPKFKSEYHQRIEREARERGVGVWGFHGFQFPKAFRQAKRRRR